MLDKHINRVRDILTRMEGVVVAAGYPTTLEADYEEAINATAAWLEMHDNLIVEVANDLGRDFEPDDHTIEDEQVEIALAAINWYIKHYKQGK